MAYTLLQRLSEVERDSFAFLAWLLFCLRSETGDVGTTAGGANAEVGEAHSPGEGGATEAGLGLPSDPSPENTEVAVTGVPTVLR